MNPGSLKYSVPVLELKLYLTLHSLLSDLIVSEREKSIGSFTTSCHEKLTRVLARVKEVNAPCL